MQFSNYTTRPHMLHYAIMPLTVDHLSTQPFPVSTSEPMVSSSILNTPHGELIARPPLQSVGT